jgi:hypothetical protein
MSAKTNRNDAEARRKYKFGELSFASCNIELPSPVQLCAFVSLRFVFILALRFFQELAIWAGLALVTGRFCR